MDASAIKALLIGIDHYLGCEVAPGLSYPSLGGCVLDSERMATFLISQLGVPAGQIRRLVSPLPQARGGPPCPSELPSAENLIAAWKGLLEQAQAGDEILIHYSGHGGRAATTLPELKGEEGIDECLVPYNIGAPGARYVRDTEIYALLRLAARRGVFTTLILDCCHAGGAARSGVRVRGVAGIDPARHGALSLVGERELLTSLWQERQVAHRGLRPERSFRSQPKGYALLAACRAQEFAYEAVLEGFEPQGALTHWLLKLTAAGAEGLTYRELHQRLIGRIHCRFPQQTPQLEGEADREVFGQRRLPAKDAINVLELGGGKPLQLRLNTGQAQGARQGARFALFGGEVRLGTAEIVDLGAVISLAEIVEAVPGARPIAPGDRALPLDPGPGWWARRLRLSTTDGRNGHPDAAFKEVGSQAMKVLVEKLEAGRSSLLPADDEAASEATFTVGVAADSCYEIYDDAGQPLAGLTPRVALGSARAEERVIERLLHLAKYAAVRELENHDPCSELAGALGLSLGLLPKGFVKGEKLRPEPFPAEGDMPTLAVGESLCVTVENRLGLPLNIAVLDLQPSWSIEQVFPARTRGDFASIDPGGKLHIPLRADLPRGFTEGIDVLKVFATLGPTSFRWLELPALDAKRSGLPALKRPESPLEQLFAALTADFAVQRSARLAQSASDEWCVAVREVRVVRQGGAA